MGFVCGECMKSIRNVSTRDKRTHKYRLRSRTKSGGGHRSKLKSMGGTTALKRSATPMEKEGKRQDTRYTPSQISTSDSNATPSLSLRGAARLRLFSPCDDAGPGISTLPQSPCQSSPKIAATFLSFKVIKTICVVITSPPEGVARYCFHPVCLSVCVCVCVSVCSANILVFYFSAIRRDIDLKFIQDTYMVVLKGQRSRSQGRNLAF